MNQIETQLAQMEEAFKRQAWPLVDMPALIKALRRAQIALSDVSAAYVAGVSNVAGFALDDIAAILSGEESDTPQRQAKIDEYNRKFPPISDTLRTPPCDSWTRCERAQLKREVEQANSLLKGYREICQVRERELAQAQKELRRWKDHTNVGILEEQLAQMEERQDAYPYDNPDVPMLIKALRRALASLSGRHHPTARRDIAAILSGQERVVHDKDCQLGSNNLDCPACIEIESEGK